MMTFSQSHGGPVDELRRYWHGEGPLWKLYWIYGVLLSTIGGTIILRVVLERTLPILVLVLLLGLALSYTAYIQISIWRSAFNIKSGPLGIDREAGLGLRA